MSNTKQYRIYVTGKFQYAVSTTESPDVVAAKAADVMKLGALRPVITLGQINFVPA